MMLLVLAGFLFYLQKEQELVKMSTHYGMGLRAEDQPDGASTEEQEGRNVCS
jgi:hypothetical protein